MKQTLLIALVGLATSFAEAAVHYKKDSPLPIELRAKFEAALATACPDTTYTDVHEVTTAERVQRFDQLFDVYYTTALTFRVKIDQAVYADYVATVDSVQYAGSNPSVDWTEILSVTCELK